MSPSEGSSPRVWGQDAIYFSGSHIDRIIPTRVGTSTEGLYRNMTLQDHPHACGDKSVNFSLISSGTGSSPRVWGQVTKKMVDDLKARIIPTRVGTRKIRFPVLFFCQDHPHACGDKKLYHTLVKPRSGSSPRVWGQEVIIFSFAYIHRIIPTRVGTSL